MSNKNLIYECIIDNISSGTIAERCDFGKFWAAAYGESGMGIAMATEGDSVAPMFPQGLAGMDIKDAAAAIKSWNLREASMAMAAANLWYNTTRRMESLHCAEPFDNYCTAGLDFEGKRVGVIGHLKMTEEIRRRAKDIRIIERMPRNGDYPDAACDFILPECDIVLITGSSLINKTLPHLLELCKNAYTILTGPTVPMCPELMSCGFDRLAGMVVTDQRAMEEKIRDSVNGTPYVHGQSWLLVSHSTGNS